MTLAQMESWAWRMLMPALLFGGVAASWVIVVVALLRVTSWWRNHRSEPWSWNWGSTGWLLFFGLQVAGGIWSENVEAWRFSLEVKSSMWALPVLAAMPGRSMARDFWWSVGWSVSAYLLWRLARAGWHHVVLGDARQWRYARFAGDVHPTYLSLHAAVAWLGCGRQWGKSSASMWGCTMLVAVALGLMGSKAGILAAAAVALVGMVLPRLWSRTDRYAVGQGAAFLVLLVGVSWGASKSDSWKWARPQRRPVRIRSGSKQQCRACRSLARVRRTLGCASLWRRDRRCHGCPGGTVRTGWRHLRE